jgi:hypothetical protein
MLTTQQLTAIKANILANPDLSSQPETADGAFAIAALYNLTASPDFWVWRTFVSKAEYVQSTGPDGTVFNWTGAGFITRSVGERDAWREIFNGSDSCNPSLPNVRQAFQDIFSGTGVAANNRAHLAAVSRRKATRIEKLLATGTGSTADPATLGYEEQVTYQDILNARNLP